MQTNWRCVMVLYWCLCGTLVFTRHPIDTLEIPSFMLHLLEEAKPPADIVRSLRPKEIDVTQRLSTTKGGTERNFSITVYATNNDTNSLIALVLSQERDREQEIQYLAFEIPAPASNERLEEAQLRIYAAVNNQHRGLYGVERLLQITLRSPEHETHNIEATPTTLSHVYLKKNSWFTINITTSFATWMQLNERKLYVYVHVLNPYTSVGGSGKLELLSHDKKTQPLLLLMYGLLDPPPPPVLQSHNVSRRSVQELEDYEEESNSVWDDDSTRSKALMTGKLAALAAGRKKPHRNLCRRQPLYVDFAEIEYDTWIVAPAGYEAYQCTGKCFYPVSEHLTPTKHAIVQTLLHTVAPRKVARACCVPTRLQPISVLYVDQHGVLTYRFSYEDMVVTECGCR